MKTIIVSIIISLILISSCNNLIITANGESNNNSIESSHKSLDISKNQINFKLKSTWTKPDQIPSSAFYNE